MRKHLLAIFIFVAASSCEKILPEAPPEDEMLDGPIKSLDNAGLSKHLAGDAAFTDEIFSPEKFEESNSGLPMVTAKLAFRNRRIGELGLSYMGGVYNKWREDGTVIDSKRRITALAVDANTSLLSNRLTLTGEAAKVLVDLPGSYSQSFGNRQWGGFLDIVGTIIQKPILGWEKARVNLALRAEYADYNLGKFRENQGLVNIADDIWAIVAALSFRPVATSVIRLNYRYQQQKDLFGNPPAKTGVVQFGFATYF